MKILSADKIRQADQYTITHEPIASIHLMERASMQIVNWVTNKFNHHHPICIIAGMGNNGGDGLAVARLLHALNYEVEIHVIAFTKTGSPDFEENLQKVKENKIPINYYNNETINIIDADSKIIIDALFGSGLDRPIEGFTKNIVKTLNKIKSTKISIDLPSGLYCDRLSDSIIFKADYTLSFQLPKLSLLLPDNAIYVGQWEILDIQLHPDFLKKVETSIHYTDSYFVHTMTKPRNKFSHKGNFGHTLIIGGSFGKIGAVILAAKASLVSGCGLTTCYIPRCGYTAIQENFPEAMVICDKNDNLLSSLPNNIESFDSIGIGPGLGQNEQSPPLLKQLFQKIKRAIVIDADAINLLAKNKELLSLLPRHTILTPHPGEFQRLVGKWNNDYEKLEMLKSFCHEYECIIVLKGQHSCICHPNGQLYFNSTGNNGMATAGSGDTLTGIITSLLAQKYQPLEAALLGTYWHGLAGDHAAIQHTPTCMIASNIIEHLSSARKEIENYNLNYNS